VSKRGEGGVVGVDGITGSKDFRAGLFQKQKCWINENAA
jgi:hypothetical protein